MLFSHWIIFQNLLKQELMHNELMLERIRKELSTKITTVVGWPKPDVNFKDIQSLLIDPKLADQAADGLERLLPVTEDENGFTFDVVLAFDARGFIYGYQLARFAHAKFIMARKPGKLPGECITQEFIKEYGKESIQIQRGLIKPGDRVLVHDDVLATGGTAEAAAKIITLCGGEIAGYNFLIELADLGGRDMLKQYVSDDEIRSLLVF